MTRKRVGRGYGSGKGGHTTGRGQKGQKARSKVKLGFEGGQLPLYQRSPRQKGFKSHKKISPPQILNIRDLEPHFKSGEVITAGKLKEKGLVSSTFSKGGIKILGDGEAKRWIIRGLDTSLSAKGKVEKVGGKVE